MLRGINGIAKLPASDTPLAATMKKLDALSVDEPLEQRLSSFYTDQNYEQLGAKPPFRRAGVAGVLLSNESFFPDQLIINPLPNGYIIGTGNGAIWSMLELFKNGHSPNGVISIDYDPSVILSGKVLVELAKRGISRDEAVAYLYGDHIPTQAGTILSHSLDDLMKVARKVIKKERNVQLRQVLTDALEKGEFKEDMVVCRDRHEFEYNKPKFGVAKPGNTLAKAGLLNTSAVIYNHWDTITKLATEGKIGFIHSNIGDERTLDFIESRIPNAKTSRNILYTSNVVDFRYRRELNGFQRFNPNGQSSYVYTSHPDNYALKTSHAPPPPPQGY